MRRENWRGAHETRGDHDEEGEYDARRLSRGMLEERESYPVPASHSQVSPMSHVEVLTSQAVQPR